MLPPAVTVRDRLSRPAGPTRDIKSYHIHARLHTRVADRLETLAETTPAVFEGDTVTVEIAGEAHEIPVERTDFAEREETVHGEHVTPHVVEPSIGIDRVVYSVPVRALGRDAPAGTERTRLALPPEVAPNLAGVFPLTDAVADRARELADRLTRRGLPAVHDDSGSIGRRYRRQDEIGTPFCVTLDERTREDDAATLRERDSAAQVRVPLDDLPALLAALRAGETTFEAVRRAHDDREQCSQVVVRGRRSGHSQVDVGVFL